uniref:50S ribosomal protein L19, chloroplastic n=1 Tax=Akkesiphycus lubricus TaxID=3022 RepID=A0A8F0JXI9_AKKLU|nr:ribosomal protein L19 [Akkesiphycus lubricus]
MKNSKLRQVPLLPTAKIMDFVESTHLKKDVSKIFVGDTVKIGVFIKEGNKERVQYYQGIILGKNNSGINLTISVRKVFQGIGVERRFLIHSPKFESIEIIKSSRVRRSKLYYLRSIVGKGSRLKQRFRTK